MIKISRIRFASDLHLEFSNNPTIQPPPKEDEILVLAGDTIPMIYLYDHRTDGRARSMKRQFERFCESVKDFHMVLLIPGNHEYYGGYYCDGVEPYNKWFKQHGYNNFLAVNKESVVVNDSYLLVLATLWTDMDNDNPNVHAQLVGQIFDSYGHARGMNDFMGQIRVYHDDPRLFSTYLAYQEHKRAKEFISDMARDFPNHELIVITHHIPTWKCVPDQFKNDVWFNGGYYSDMEQFIKDRPNIKHWVHGHNHFNSDMFIEQCNVISNQRGYPPSLSSPDRSIHFDDFGFDKWIELRKE